MGTRVSAAGVAALCVLHGCTSHEPAAPRTEGERILVAEEIVTPGGLAGVPSPAASDWPDTATSGGGTVTIIEPTKAEAVPVEVETAPVAPAVSQAGAATETGPVLVDAKVGEVSGRPVFASEFLEPMAARLSAEATKLNRRQWMEFAEQEIRSRLIAMVQDVLLEEEARSRLSDEKKQGLIYFLTAARDEARSAAGGSTELAKQKLLDEKGMTEEQYLRWKEQRLLISDLVWPILRRVHVSSADIRRFYAQNKDIFLPPDAAHFRLILLRASDAEGRERVGAALDSGEPFEQVARLEANRYKAAEGGAMDPVSFAGDYAEADLLRVKPLNEAARTLSPGTWTGPVEASTDVYWIFLDRIEHTALSLYEAQLAIDRALRDRYEREELDRYVSRLRGPLDRAEENDIVQQLLVIAADRYAPPAGR